MACARVILDLFTVLVISINVNVGIAKVRHYFIWQDRTFQTIEAVIPSLSLSLLLYLSKILKTRVRLISGNFKLANLIVSRSPFEIFKKAVEK